MRIFRRQIELGKIEVDPVKRPALAAFLTKAINGALEIPAEAMADLSRVWEVFDRNVEATLRANEPLLRMFRPDVPGDRKKAVAAAFSLAEQATLNELGPVFSGAKGAREFWTRKRPERKPNGAMRRSDWPRRSLKTALRNAPAPCRTLI